MKHNMNTVSTYIHTYMHTHTYTYTHTYIHRHARTHTHTYTHTYIHTYILHKGTSKMHFIGLSVKKDEVAPVSKPHVVKTITNGRLKVKHSIFLTLALRWVQWSPSRSSRFILRERIFGTYKVRQEVVLAPEVFWMTWRGEKSLPLARIDTHVNYIRTHFTVMHDLV
jgi:hypothetical protein